MTTPASLPAVDYASRDFAGISASLYARAVTTVPDWTSRADGDFGVVLVDLLAYVGDLLSYQIDRVASETFLPTARRRESVVNIAALMGYRPTGILPAVLTMQFTGVGTSTATIPAGTLVTTTPSPDSPLIYFETLADVTFTAPGPPTAPQYVTVQAVEGRTISNEAIGISTGDMNQFYPLLDQPVIDGSIILQVQDDPSLPIRTWVYVDNIVESGPLDEVFSTDTTDDGITLIIFGNGVTGKIPTRGAALTATYRIGSGAAGNVAAQTVTTLVNSIPDVTAITNVTPGIGGQDEEDIESIRSKTPYAFAANNRAINDEDWTGLALRVPGVAKALSVSHVPMQPVIYVAPSDGSIAQATLLSSVVSFLQPRSLAGATVRAAAASYFYVDIAATINVHPAYARESVRQAVLTELKNLFAFNNSKGVADFGALVSEAAVYSTILSVPGVLSCTLSVLAPAGGGGAADQQALPAQIPQLGTPSIVATGGITPFTPTVEVVGTNPTQPTASGAPVVSLTRCDTSSTHLEMTWTAGANSTLWYVELTWLDASSNVVIGPTLIGPYASASAVIDTTKDTVSTSIRIRTAAYNGTTGPQYSPTTTVANPCH